MKFERMHEIEEDLFAQIRQIRETKGREYATDEDTLADFKEVAAESGITPLQCWATYVKKHERAIDSFVREGEVKSEAIEGRILDVVVYHLLLLGLIEDLAPQAPRHPGPYCGHQSVTLDLVCTRPREHPGHHHANGHEWWTTADDGEVSLTRSGVSR